MLIVASDGGADLSCSGWGVSFGLATDANPPNFDGQVEGEDHTPFAAEMQGFIQISNALITCRRSKAAAFFPSRILILIDCKGAIDFAHRTHPPSERGAIWHKIRELYAALCDAADIQLCWVPSHGKRPDWRPPDGSWTTFDVMRLFNKRADDAATAGTAKRLLARVARPWDRQRKRLCGDARKVLAYARTISDDYTEWLRYVFGLNSVRRQNDAEVPQAFESVRWTDHDDVAEGTAISSMSVARLTPRWIGPQLAVGLTVNYDGEHGDPTEVVAQTMMLPTQQLAGDPVDDVQASASPCAEVDVAGEAPPPSGDFGWQPPC